MFKRTILARMILVILLFLVPALLWYTFSNRTSVEVVERLIHDSTSKQLTFLTNQLNNSINQLSDFAANMAQDPNVREFMGYSFVRTEYEEVRLYSSIAEKLELNDIKTSWPSTSTVYSRLEQRAISGSAVESFLPDQIRHKVKSNVWVLRDEQDTPIDYFYYYATVPAVYDRFEDIHAIIEVKFPQTNIGNILDQFEATSNGQAFLFSAESGRIIRGKSEANPVVQSMQVQLRNTNLKDSGNIRVLTDEDAYELYYERVSSLGWYVVEYVPVETILQPIRANQRNFYVTMILLLAVGVALVLLVYRNVQRPIQKLIRNIERVKQGDYVITSLASSRNDEFQYLFDRFNEMTLQIRQLIENVYEEKLRSRDATLKQLQSQINPHFLYNCLSFIMNMTKLKKHDDVVMMTYHLSQYYRYVTRTEMETVPLSMELEFTRHYLKIIQMRFVQIEMEYDIPESIKNVMIPKLLIQPMIENAIKHGIEATGESVRLHISAYQNPEYVAIVVEDNGAGMTSEQIAEMTDRIQQPLSSEIGTGLWNVNQRLMMHFGEGAGLDLQESAALGGLKVILHWKNHGSEAMPND